MGAHHDPSLTRNDVEEFLSTGCGALGTGEQRDSSAVIDPAQPPALREIAEHARDRAMVLNGKNLGGREQRSLTARVNDSQHRSKRN